MAQETKIVKGGFRATLALLISIIALILSIIAYTTSTREEDFKVRIKNLQTSLEKMKQESSKQIEKLRDETGNVLEKLGKTVKNKQDTETKEKEAKQ
jgi:Skp family chaperone for outer membrane proteins